MKVVLGDSVLVPLQSGIIILTENFDIVMCNQIAGEFLGIAPEDLVGRNGRQFPFFTGLKEFFLQDFFPDKDNVSYEIKLAEQVVMVNLTTLKSQSGSVYYSIVLSNLTEFCRLSELAREQERLAVVGRMAAGVVHELKNPMTAIKGFAQLLKERGSQETGPYVDYIIEEINNCVGIINNFLKLAKPNPPSLESRSLNAAVQEIVDMIEARAFLQNVKVETELALCLPECLFDAAQLKQVFLNLVDNALEAMQLGGVLRIKTFPAGFALVGVAFQDTGVGIPKKFLDKIGSPFFSTRENGTGLGLFMCQSIIQAHGGKIEVESEEGKGTTFRIYLPAVGNSPV